MALAKKGTCGGKNCEDWEEEKGLKDWLRPVAGDEGKAACRFCKCEMPARYSELQQHVAAANHKMNAPTGSSTPLADTGPCVLKSSRTATTVCNRKQALDLLTISSKTREEEKDEAMVGNGPGHLVEAFQFSTEPTLEDIRKLQSVFTTERGWGKYHQPRNLLLALVGEVGELAELFQWREEAPEGLPGWTALEREALSDELSDVLIYLVALADKCRVDLPSAALHKIGKNRLKYPAEQVYGSSKKYTEYQK